MRSAYWSSMLLAAFAVAVGWEAPAHVPASTGSRVVAARQVAAEFAALPASPPTAAPLRPQAAVAASTPRRSGERGGFLGAAGDGPVVGTGRLHRYLVEVEVGSPLEAQEFAATVDRILHDPRSWTASRKVAFQRVGRGRVDLRISLARPATVDRLCRPMRTRGIYSCWNRRQAVINLVRWQRGAATYGGDLAGYRRYLINHEVGHALRYRHAACPSRGAPAPVMMQQTKKIGTCVRNPWPFPHARQTRAIVR